MGWIGVDLDGTLAEYNGWNNGTIGEPVIPMLKRVIKWLEDGKDVRIMTARVGRGEGRSQESGRWADDDFIAEQKEKIQLWCLKHLGKILPITHEKDFLMETLWDDRAVQIIPNTGLRADGLED